MNTPVVIQIENLSKQYRLGEVGTGTLSHDLNRWWRKLRGKEDPYAKIGAVNDRTQTADSDYVWALRNINFEVKKGEILGIIGKNGAGKSTLLKILSKITAPTTGVMRAKGRIAALLEVGTGFHPELTGRENVYLNGTILGMTKSEVKEQLDEIIDFAGVRKYIDTPVKRYSSGMIVRLGFAVAAHLNPEILIVDEVLAVGDADFQKKAIGKMQEISEGGGRTVLIVSHNMNSIAKLCKRCIVLDNGEVDFSGPTQQAIEHYLNNGENQQRKIIDLAKYNNDAIVLSKVKVNQSEWTEQTLGKMRNLDIQLSFQLKKQLHVSLAAYLLDNFGNRLGYFALGRLDKEQYIYNLEADEHTLFATINLPYLNKGSYYLSLHLIQDRKVIYVTLEHAVHIDFQGFNEDERPVFLARRRGALTLTGTMYIAKQVNEKQAWIAPK
ncbi:MAG: ABC transporter ATP-binding protein [Saprospiraceae bacterium]